MIDCRTMRIVTGVTPLDHGGVFELVGALLVGMTAETQIVRIRMRFDAARFTMHIVTVTAGHFAFAHGVAGRHIHFGCDVLVTGVAKFRITLRQILVKLGMHIVTVRTSDVISAVSPGMKLHKFRTPVTAQTNVRRLIGRQFRENPEILRLSGFDVHTARSMTRFTGRFLKSKTGPCAVRRSRESIKDVFMTRLTCFIANDCCALRTGWQCRELRSKAYRHRRSKCQQPCNWPLEKKYDKVHQKDLQT